MKNLKKQYPLLLGRYKMMIERCYNKSNTSYNNYGAIGVTVCKEWLDKENGFNSYATWALSKIKYENMIGLEIDKDIGSSELGIYPPIYSPDTCRFLTKEENARATKLIRVNNSSGYRGVHKTTRGKKWSAEIRIGKKLIHLGLYDKQIDAAKAYDYYILLNNLINTINNVLLHDEKLIHIDINGYAMKKKKTSSFYGVHFEKSRNKWKASISLQNKKSIFLGRFSTELEASNAIKKYNNKEQIPFND